jgi:hypothetical protein
MGSKTEECDVTVRVCEVCGLVDGGKNQTVYAVINVGSGTRTERCSEHLHTTTQKGTILLP